MTGEQLAARWMAHRKVSQELLDRVPDDQADFRPWPGAMTVAALGAHIALAHHMFTTVAANDEAQPPDAASVPQDLPGVRALMRRLTEEDLATLQGLDAQALAQARSRRGREQAAEGFVLDAREHEIHHKGELFEYVRILGAAEVPPWVMR